jgi:hypothetical protein
MILQEVERRLPLDHDPTEKGPFIHFRSGKPVVEEV